MFGESMAKLWGGRVMSVAKSGGHLIIIIHRQSTQMYVTMCVLPAHINEQLLIQSVF